MENLKMTLESSKRVGDRTVDTYKVGRYRFRKIIYPDGTFHISGDCKKNKYVTEIYSVEDYEMNITNFSIKFTVNDLLLSSEKIQIAKDEINEAISVVDILEKNFAKKGTKINAEFLEAADTVCLECPYTENECNNCPVRKMIEKMEGV